MLANPIRSEIFDDTYINKNGEDVLGLQKQVDAYNQALDNSYALEKERDALLAKKSAISEDNLEKIEKLLPQNVDNIRLILEIQEMAQPFGMTLKDIKYNVVKETTENEGAVAQAAVAKTAPKDYGVFDLEFSTSGTYDNFLRFTKTLESNLRIVDISSIAFSSSNIAVTGATAGMTPQINSPEIYKYNFKIKTYWLKN